MRFTEHPAQLLKQWLVAVQLLHARNNMFESYGSEFSEFAAPKLGVLGEEGSSIPSGEGKLTRIKLHPTKKTILKCASSFAWQARRAGGSSSLAKVPTQRHQAGSVHFVQETLQWPYD